VENEKSSEARGADCCGGSDGANGSTSGCSCGATPPRRSLLRTLIAGAVILAAVGVGAYSLMEKRAADPNKQAASCCPTAAPAAGKAASAKSSCCPGGSAAPKCAAQPAKGADSAACRRTCGSR